MQRKQQATNKNSRIPTNEIVVGVEAHGATGRGRLQADRGRRALVLRSQRRLLHRERDVRGLLRGDVPQQRHHPLLLLLLLPGRLRARQRTPGNARVKAAAVVASDVGAVGPHGALLLVQQLLLVLSALVLQELGREVEARARVEQLLHAVRAPVVPQPAVTNYNEQEQEQEGKTGVRAERRSEMSALRRKNHSRKPLLVTAVVVPFHLVTLVAVVADVVVPLGVSGVEPHQTHQRRVGDLGAHTEIHVRAVRALRRRRRRRGEDDSRFLVSISPRT